MDSTLFYALYLILTALLFAPSLWAKFALGGENFSRKNQLMICLYNAIVVTGHILFAHTGHLEFIGETRNPVVLNVTGYMVLAYVYAIPRPIRYTVEEMRAMLTPNQILKSIAVGKTISTI